MQDQINALDEKLEECKSDVHGQLEEGNLRMDNFKTNLKDIERKLDIVLELFDDFKGFFKVMGWIGKLTVWTAKVGAILVAAWAIFEGHVK